MNKIINKLSALSINEVAEIVSKMFADTTNEGAMILEAGLTVLESKMSTDDFVRFCDKF